MELYLVMSWASSSAVRILNGSLDFDIQDQADNVEDLKLKLKNVLREKSDLASGGKDLEDVVCHLYPLWKLASTFLVLWL